MHAITKYFSLRSRSYRKEPVLCFMYPFFVYTFIWSVFSSTELYLLITFDCLAKPISQRLMRSKCSHHLSQRSNKELLY